MASKRHERTLARRAALQVLYTGDIRGVAPTSVQEGVAPMTDTHVLPTYARELVAGVEANLSTIDRALELTSENWSLDRMPIVDRSLLRLAAYEMMYVDKVPISVSINEAVELAKRYGGEDESPRFVNGVLGRIATMLEEGGVAAFGSADSVPPVAAAASAVEPVRGADVAVADEPAAAASAPAPAPEAPKPAAEEGVMSVADLFAAESANDGR